jgi:hypothetical protein
VNVQRFKERVLHGTAFFKGRYWMIGGALPTLPQTTPGPVLHVPQSDIWSSSDGRTWRRETANAAFGTRWIHKTLVFDNAIWLLSGVRADGTGANEVWKSLDGVNWTQVNQVTPWGPIGFVAAMAATVFNNQMWVVISGRTYSSTDGATWTAQSAPAAIGGGFQREYASFHRLQQQAVVHRRCRWSHSPVPGPPATFNRVAQNDVWSSNDGITWTQVSAPGVAPFAARQQHAAFVLGGKLWVFGGKGATDPSPANDAWTTTDGVTWTKAALSTFMVNSWLPGVVQETNRITFIGGIIRSFSNKVWQTTNGESWTALAPLDYRAEHPEPRHRVQRRDLGDRRQSRRRLRYQRNLAQLRWLDVDSDHSPRSDLQSARQSPRARVQQSTVGARRLRLFHHRRRHRDAQQRGVVDSGRRELDEAHAERGNLVAARRPRSRSVQRQNVGHRRRTLQHAVQRRLVERRRRELGTGKRAR